MHTNKKLPVVLLLPT